MTGWLDATFRRHRELVLYGIIGATGATIDFVLYVVLTSVAGVAPPVATALSVSAGIVNNFILNAYLNFRTTDRLLQRFVSFFAVGLVGVLISIVIVYVLHDVVGLGAVPAKLISIPPVVLGQFVFNRRYAFAAPIEPASPSPAPAKDGPVPSSIESSSTTPSTSVPRTAVVIGGGYTGMVAALRLAQAGQGVTLLEHGSTLGGLAGGFEVEGAGLERAYHHLFSTDTSIIALADELGIGDALQWHSSRTSLYYDGVMYPFAGPMDLLRFSPLHLHNRIRAGVVALYLQKTARWDKFKTVTALSWMRKASGKQVTSVIWEPLLRGKFDEHYDKVAMSWLWARIHTRGNSKADGETEEKLGYFAGGFGTFTAALEKALVEAGVSIRTGTPVSSITSNEHGVRVTTAEGDRLDVDACVATVPSGVFAALTAADPQADDAYRAQLASIDYLGARLYIFSSSQDLSPYYWHNINDTDLPFLVFIQHTNLVGTKDFGGRHIYYVATYLDVDHPLFTCSDADLEDTWSRGISKIFPDFDTQQVREKHFFRFPHAQHIVDTSYEQRLPSHRSPLQGVYLSNFSQIYPEDRGTNFAVREGERVAALVAEDLET